MPSSGATWLTGRNCHRSTKEFLPASHRNSAEYELQLNTSYIYFNNLISTSGYGNSSKLVAYRPVAVCFCSAGRTYHLLSHLLSAQESQNSRPSKYLRSAGASLLDAGSMEEILPTTDVCEKNAQTSHALLGQSHWKSVLFFIRSYMANVTVATWPKISCGSGRYDKSCIYKRECMCV